MPTGGDERGCRSFFGGTVAGTGLAGQNSLMTASGAGKSAVTPPSHGATGKRSMTINSA